MSLWGGAESLLGLGEKTGIDLPNELQGLVPSPEWKRDRMERRFVDPPLVS